MLDQQLILTSLQVLKIIVKYLLTMLLLTRTTPSVLMLCQWALHYLLMVQVSPSNAMLHGGQPNVIVIGGQDGGGGGGGGGGMMMGGK